MPIGLALLTLTVSSICGNKKSCIETTLFDTAFI